MTLRLGRWFVLDLFRGGRCYIAGKRLHHFWIGVALLIPGAMLAWDDRHDFPWSWSDT